MCPVGSLKKAKGHMKMKTLSDKNKDNLLQNLFNKLLSETITYEVNLILTGCT